MTEERDRISLKFWQNSDQLALVGQIADVFYDDFQKLLEDLNTQVDADTAPIKMVELLGWERDIERFEGETDELFRKRVKFALANARDAGCRRGFELIWERLGLGKIKQTERFDEDNWDVINLEIDETVFGKYMELLNVLIRQYGRTCRRYEFQSLTENPVGVRAINFNCGYFYTKTSFNLSSTSVGINTFEFTGNTFNTKAVL